MHSLSFLAASVVVIGLASCKQETAQAYPFDTCPVSGGKLGSHGDPYVFSRDGQEIKLCCESCLDEFNANADKLMKEIKERIKP